MNFFNRGILSLKRRKSRNITMLIIMGMILSLMVMGMSILYAAEDARVLARETLGGQVSLSYNFQDAVLDEEKDFAPKVIESHEAALLAEQENVVDYNAIAYAYGNGVNIETIGGTSNLERALDFSGTPITPPNVAVVGLHNSGLSGLLDADHVEIIEGRHLTLEDQGREVVLMEKSLADKNHLGIGDYLKVESADQGRELDLEIVGIYQAEGSRLSERMGGYGLQLSLIRSENRIYTPSAMALDLRENEITVGGSHIVLPSLGTDRVVYYMDAPENIQTFLEEAKEYPLDWESFRLDANDRAYRYMVEPVEEVSSLARKMILVTMIGGLAILSLVLMLWVKERNYETAVLLSMGESKKNIIYQYLSEMLMIAAVALIFAFLIGGFASESLGNRLMDRQLAEGEGEATLGEMLESRLIGLSSKGAGVDPEEIQPIEELEIGTGLYEKGKITGMSFSLMILAVLLPVSNVMRHSPKSILSRGD